MATHQLVDWFAHRRELSRSYAAVITVLVYVKALAYLRGSRSTVPSVAMLSQVAWDMLGFVIILFVAIPAFASSFYTCSTAPTAHLRRCSAP
jgi:hypothetical protein